MAEIKMNEILKEAQEKIDQKVKDIKEKIEPRHVNYEGDGYAEDDNGDLVLVYDMAACPRCGYQMEESSETWMEPYCCHCGQKLDWSTPFEEAADESDC